MAYDAEVLVSLLVGLLGFLSAILVLIFTSISNRKNLELNKEIVRREAQKSYNRVLGSLLKVYHAFLNHRMLFNEDGVKHMSDRSLIVKIDELDSFEDNIDRFRVVVDNELEIIPELTLFIHELLELLGKFKMVSQHFASMEVQDGVSGEELDLFKLKFKRAHNYSYEKVLDQYFLDLIELISVRADVKDDFLKELKSYNSKESFNESTKVQSEIKNRMQESLSRQMGTDINFDDFLGQD